MSNRQYIFLFTLICLFWGGSFLAIHFALKTFAPFTAAFLRVFVAFAATFLFILFTNRKAFKDKNWFYSIAFGLLLIGIPWCFLFWGAQFLSPGLVGILNAMTPLWVAAFTPILTPNDRLSVQKILGIALGFLGVSLIFLPKIFSNGVTASFWGVTAIIGMSIFYALGTLSVRRFNSKTAIATDLFYQLLGSTLFLGVIALILESPLESLKSQIPVSSLLSILYLGILSTALAIGIYLKILREKDSLAASASVYFVPVVSLILDALILKTFLTPLETLGAMIILMGLLILKKKKNLRKNLKKT